MKTSKPFAFVLWADSGELPLYIWNTWKGMRDFHYMHWIRHEAEAESPSLIKRVKREKPKAHYHCVVQWRKPFDYAANLEPLVKAWATSHTDWGECPFTWDRLHDGKVLNLSAWLAYVIHDERYMAYCEKHLLKPETHKRAYTWDDIQSTDDILLERQCQNALVFIEQCWAKDRRVDNAKEIGFEAPSLTNALENCETYQQMLVAEKIFKARYNEALAREMRLARSE